ncbi:MAG: sensor histidine kinase [Humibacter sp.]
MSPSGALSRARVVSSQSDEEIVRRASLRVALQFALAVVIVAVVGLIGAILFVLHQVPQQLLFPLRDLSMTLGARDFLLAGIAGGAIAVVVAAAMALVLTRRAVRPLAEALRLQRDFVTDASHELRTPLAVLDMRIELLERETDMPEPVAEELHALRHDAERLNNVITDLLEAAALQTASQPGDAIDAGLAVGDAVDEITVLAAERSIEIEYDYAGPFPVGIPAERLRRCVVILLDNAVRHSEPGSRVLVEIAAVRRRVRIRVVDHGTGISGIDPSRIFDRFAHSRPARESDEVGRGIGLALVKDTANRYGGAVKLVSTSPEGSEFTLSFPLARTGRPVG